MNVVKVPGVLMKQAWGGLISSRRPGAAVTLHQHRCGSSVVGKMLADHPQISWRGEALTRNMMRWQRRKGSRDGWTCDPARVIRREMRGAPRGWFGCEVTTHNLNRLQLSCGEALASLQAMGFSRFIVLERRNHLRRYLSSRIAAEANNWHNKATGARPRRIRLDPMDAGMDDESGFLLDRLRSDQASIEEMRRLTAALGGIHLVYEDHVERDPVVAYKMVCDYIGVAPHIVEPRLVRANPYPIMDMLENYDEIEEVLAGSDFEWMLAE